MIDLRGYQSDALAETREHIRNGARSVLINAPTGSGKTVLASALMELVQEKGKRASFVVDRLSLIDQTSATLFRYGMDHGVVQSTHPNFRPSLPLQVCSVQTVSRRGWPESDLDVFDEAHVLHAAHKGRIQQLKNGTGLVIGLTATPFTKGLAKWFDAVVNVTTTRKLINDGWLVPYRIFSCAEPDMTGVKVMSTGEWDSNDASKQALQVVGDVVAEYLKHGQGRKFICSGVDTAHVEELCRQFIAAGVNVASYTYKDDQEDRAETTVEFRKPTSTIQGLVTVTAASRGFDVPDVSCVIMARPLRKSLAEHIQLLGRGLRISPETGKQDCLVLCHSGNAARFFGKCESFFDDGITELDDGNKKKKEAPKKAEVEPVICPSCKHTHKPMPSCPVCGHEYPRRISVQHVPGTLRELIAGKGQYQHILDRDIWPMVCGYAMERREGEQAKKYALAIYRDMTGAFPQGKWFDSTRPVEPTPEVRSRIRAAQIKYAHARAKQNVAA